MIHHAIRGFHSATRHTHKLVSHMGGYYFRNPDKAYDHASTAMQGAGLAGKAMGRAAVQYGPTIAKVTGRLALSGGVHIGKMAWTHGPKVAKHSAKFMVKVL